MNRETRAGDTAARLKPRLTAIRFRACGFASAFQFEAVAA
jgi:hypothetical protein